MTNSDIMTFIYAGIGKNIKLKSNTNNGINPKLVILLVEIKSVKSLAVFCRSFILEQNKCCNNLLRYALYIDCRRCNVHLSRVRVHQLKNPDPDPANAKLD